MRANPGDIVRLAAFEDQPEQVGIVISRRPKRLTMYVVQLRPEDRTPPGTQEDGLRELGEDQILQVLERD